MKANSTKGTEVFIHEFQLINTTLFNLHCISGRLVTIACTVYHFGAAIQCFNILMVLNHHTVKFDILILTRRTIHVMLD